MNLFTFAEPEVQETIVAEEDVNSLRKGAVPHFIFRGKEPKTQELPTEKLTKEYHARIDEIFSIINSKKRDSTGGIAVEKVVVKLGVDVGGKIGWFVEGRLDVSFAFEVEFKVS